MQFISFKDSETPVTSEVGAASMAAALFLALCAAILRSSAAFSIITQCNALERHRATGLLHRSCLLQMASDAMDDATVLDLKKRLCLYNTLTKEKQQFTALDKEQKKVSFYR